VDPTAWISACLRAWVIAALIAAGSAPATANQAAPPRAGSAGIFPAVGAGLFAAGSRAVRVFSDSDGLPHNTVHAICLDREGTLWIGTQDGAARYDGRTWTVVNMPNRLSSNFIRTIRATRDGSVFFGTQSGGLARLRDGAWTIFGEGPGTLPSARVNALIEATSRNGASALWIATHGGGLARLENERFTVWTKREGLPSLRVWGLAEIPDAQGNPVVWVGTEGGLARLAPGADRFEVDHAFDGLSVNQILSVPGPGGPTPWVGTYGKGIAKLTPTGWQFLTSRQGMPSDYLTSLQASQDEAGEPVVFAGTDGGGLARITPSGIDVLSNSA